MFTDSVIARLPEVQVEEDAVAQLFASDARLPAPSLSPPARPNAFWHEPGNTMHGQSNDTRSNAKPPTAAAQAALAASAGRSGAADARKRSVTMTSATPPQAPVMGDPHRRLPAGALGGPAVGPDGIAIPIERPTVRRNSLPAGALREGRAPRAAEPVMTEAAEAEAAAQGTRTLESDTNAPSGLDLDIPPANTNSMRAALPGGPTSSMRARPAISAVVDKNSLRAKSGPVSADPIAMPMGTGAGAGNPSMRTSAGNPNSLRASGVEPSTSTDAGGPPSGRAKTTSGAADSIPPESAEAPNQRPHSGKERRAEARRAARRKAAKHLPPPPSNARTHSWDPARITLVAFASVLLIGVLGLGAAEAGIWVLPPRAAAMLGLGDAHASLSKTAPDQQPHLVMPQATEAPSGVGVAPEPARVPAASATPVVATPMAAAAEPVAAPAAAEPAAGPADPSAAVAAAPVAATTTTAPSATTPATGPSVAAAPTTAAARAVVMNLPPGAVAPFGSVAAPWSMVEPEPEPAPLAPPAFAPEASPSAASVTDPIPPVAASAVSAPSAPAPQPYAAAPVSAAAAQLRAAPGQSPAASAVVAPAAPQLAPTAPQLAPAAPQLAPTAPQPAAAAPALARAHAGDSTVDVDDSATDEAASGAGTPGDRAVAQKMVALARNKLKSRDAAGAAALMLRQVTNDPEDHHAMEVLVRAWIAMGRGDDAVGYAELIVKKRPRRASYRVLEGDARLSAGDAAGAQVAWRVALQLEPDNVEAKRRLALQ